MQNDKCKIIVLLRNNLNCRATSLRAAGGRCSAGAVCAAVDKIEEMREPEDFIGHRKRKDPAATSPTVRYLNHFLKKYINFQLSTFNFQFARQSNNLAFYLCPADK